MFTLSRRYKYCSGHLTHRTPVPTPHHPFDPPPSNSMPQIISGMIVALSPAPNSFPFSPKNLFVSEEGVILGSAGQPGTQGEPSRTAELKNGWFGPLPPPKKPNPLDEEVYPLSLSAIHAKLWSKGTQVRINERPPVSGNTVLAQPHPGVHSVHGSRV
jgi:hypothetical protein